MGQFLPFSLSIPLSPEAIDPFCRAFFFSLQVTRSAKTTWDEKTPPFGSWRQLNPCLSPAPLLHFQLSCLLEILATRMPVSWRTQESYAYIVAQALAMSLIQVSRMALKIIGEKKQKKLLDLNISKSSHFYVAECFSFQSLSYWNLHWWDQYVWTLSRPIMIHIWWRLEIAVILHEQRMPRECRSFSSEGADSPRQLSAPFTKVYGAGTVIGSGG